MLSYSLLCTDNAYNEVSCVKVFIMLLWKVLGIFHWQKDFKLIAD